MRKLIHTNQNHPVSILILAVFLFSFIFPAYAEAKYDYIDITKPFIKKIPIAVPSFKEMADNSEALKKAGEAAELLSETLDFTGYFKYYTFLVIELSKL